MKYGLIVHKPTSNIGDDIQSLACEKLMPRVDYYIDREEIDIFEPIDQVAVLMTGWWMWKKFNWPPASKIIPFFIGFHYQSFKELNYWNQIADEKYISNGIGQKYLEAYAPIGCRDLSTLNQMQKYSIPSYFSGCITLTLDGNDYLDEKMSHEKYIVLCDVGKEVETKVKEQLKGTNIAIKVVTHNKKSETSFNWEKRRERVIELLKIYKNALCVITFRLHAALPCLALETPVLLVRKALDNTRFTPYDQWLNYCSQKEFLLGESKFDLLHPVYNKTIYQEQRNDIIQKVKMFFNEVEKTGKTFDCFYSNEEIYKWRINMLRETCELYRNELQKKVHELKEVKRSL